MFFSIIIPVYNAERYLRDCLDSCLEQDLANDDYEIICVDGGSTDSSFEILTENARKHRPIKVFSQENKGVSAARNVGLDNAEGEYILFVDSDDLIRRNCLKEIKDVISRTNSCCLRFNAYIGDSDDAGKFKKDPSAQSVFLPHQREMLWRHVLKRCYIEKHHIRFREDLTYYEDNLFLVDYLNVNNVIDSYPEYIYFYRIHSESLTAVGRKHQLTKQIHCFFTVFETCSKRIRLPDNNKELYYNLWKKLMVYLFRFIPELPYRERLILLRKFKEIKPYLNVKRIDKKTTDKALYRCIRRSSAFRRFEAVVYANALGAHLIVLRRKITDTKYWYLCKHPRRFLRDPMAFQRTA